MSSNFDDLTGKRFGKWTVLYRVPAPKNIVRQDETFWWCRCDCGTEKPVYARHLKSGNSKSCGCRAHNIKHGESHPETPLYRAWRKMCHGSGRKTAPKIPICDEWRHDFFTFATWIRARGYREGLFISRIDIKQGWFPENVCLKIKLQAPKGKRLKKYPAIPKIRKDGTRRTPNVD